MVRPNRTTADLRVRQHQLPMPSMPRVIVLVIVTALLWNPCGVTGFMLYRPSVHRRGCHQHPSLQSSFEQYAAAAPPPIEAARPTVVPLRRTTTSLSGAVTAATTTTTATITTTAAATTTATSNIGFYVHIPYCRQRCRYCDFAIVPIGNAATSSNSTATTGFTAMDAAYRDALLQELELLRTVPDELSAKTTLSSIYFGGGTPSLAPVETIRVVLDQMRQQFDFAENIEITMEMDPGTFDEAQLQSLVNDCGVNRVSLGVQSLQNDVLQQIGRVHRVEDIYDAIRILRKTGIDNYSIDLISGLPGVSLAEWADTLEIVLRDFSPNHLSIYDLQVEQGTVFGKWYERDAAASGDYDEAQPPVAMAPAVANRGPNLPSPDDCAYMYKYASGYLRYKGFEHYEISSYARNENSERSCRSVHNQVYWAYETEWYAIGLGATSFLQKHRFARPRAMADYIAWVNNMTDVTRNEAQAWLPPMKEPSLEPIALSSPKEQEVDVERLTDIILTRLRTKDGLDLEWLECAYSKEIVESIIRGAQLGLEMGLAQLDDANADNNTLRLVDPQGFLFSNYIISSIFAELGVEGED